MDSTELQGAMKALGDLSQGELAKRLGVRPETVHRWLRGVKGKPRNVPGPAAIAIQQWVRDKVELNEIVEDSLAKPAEIEAPGEVEKSIEEVI
jgi:transcriptional regulator with XRE-family HTH domain